MAKKQKRSAERWRYVLVADQQLPLEEQSVFVLRPLTAPERAEVKDNLVRRQHFPDGSQTIVERTHRLTLDLALQNIEAIENFPVGEPAPWPKGREARLAYLEQLADEDIHEIGNEIWAQATLGEDIPKSSPPERTSASGGDSAASTSTTAGGAPTTPG